MRFQNDSFPLENISRSTLRLRNVFLLYTKRFENADILNLVPRVFVPFDQQSENERLWE